MEFGRHFNGLFDIYVKMLDVLFYVMDCLSLKVHMVAILADVCDKSCVRFAYTHIAKVKTLFHFTAIFIHMQPIIILYLMQMMQLMAVKVYEPSRIIRLIVRIQSRSRTSCTK